MPNDIPPPPPWPLAWRLAAGQIVSWGVLFYAFAATQEAIHISTGWSRPFLSGGLSLGLFVWGACTFPVGAILAREGGRRVMTAASMLGALALILMGTILHPAAYLVSWILLGIAMAGLLYEPAFAVVTAAFGPQYRRGILLITFVAGLASTVFIPVTHLAVSRIGWQGTLVALSVFQFLVCVPLHYFGLPQIRLSPAAEAPPKPHFRSLVATTFRELHDPRFLGLALWFPAHTAAFSGLTFLLLPLLSAAGVDDRSMLITVAAIGPMQVIGRLLLAARVREYSTLHTGAYALAAIALGVAALLIPTSPALQFPKLLVFAIFYGSGNGIMTILRGTIVTEVYGPDRYPLLNGALAAPTILAQAISPLLVSSAWTLTHRPESVIGAILLLIAVSELGRRLTLRAISTNRAASPPPSRSSS